MKKISLILMIASLCSYATAQTLTPAAALLFKDVKTKLSITQRNHIAKASGATLSSDKTGFSIEGMDASMKVYSVDVNNDKTEELFVMTESSEIYGNTGAGFSFFVKGQDGIYKSIFDQMGYPSVVISGKQQPDIQLGVPGMTMPVWGWNGKEYVILKNYDTKGKQIKDLDTLSREYSSTIK